MTDASPWRLARRGLWGFRGSHTAVACGVAVAATVLVGALVVGESVRGSLRDLTLQRLGRIDDAIVPGQPFRAELADEIEAENPGCEAQALVLAPVSLSRRSDEGVRRAGRATFVGCDEEFFRFGLPLGATAKLQAYEGGVFLTEELAQELGIKPGDSVVLRSGVVSALPADSPLGEKEDTVASRRVKVTAVLPAEGLARFALAPTQGEPRNVFAPLGLAQRLLDIEGEATAIVIARDSPDQSTRVTPQLADYGLSLDEVRPGVWQLESRELVLPDTVAAAAKHAWPDSPVAEVVTYLANTIRIGERSIPYSTVAGVAGPTDLLPLAARNLGKNQIVLSDWAAVDLGAEVGDDVTLTFYEPESTHGVLREAAPVTLELAAVAPLSDDSGKPTAAADPRWTPRLEGVTDARSISDWDLPFELVEPIRQADEDYWDEHSTTPKAFVSLALAEKLWASRWGSTSLLRVAAPDADRDQLVDQLLAQIDPAERGFAPVPIKQQGLAASSGTTPFDVLFLLFSFFLIGSALLLIALLTWLAIDARRGELGLLGAVGYDRASVRRWLLRELAPVAGFGAVLGAAFGAAYASGLLYLLRTVWLDAVGAPFLRLHVSPATVLLGAAAAWGVAMLTIVFAVRSAAKTPPRRLLAGGAADPAGARGSTNLAGGVAAACAALSGMAILSGAKLQGESAAGAFFGAGALTLTALVALLYRFSQARSERLSTGASLGRLATLNLRRRSGRSLLIVGLIAAACFLLLATSAFRLPPTEQGTGGYDLIAEAAQPLHHDLATREGRRQLGFGSKFEGAFGGVDVQSFRVQPGEDASCRNLYQTSQPRVLGVDAWGDDQRTGFSWAAYDSKLLDPWGALEEDSKDSIPVVLDFNTAMYSLKLYGGVGAEFEINDEAGRPVRLRVAGLLKNSVLQGDLLMSEENFLRLFPSVGGYQFFLIDAPDEPEALGAVLEDVLADYGFDAEPAKDRLARFLAVQNTYLSTFQSLGALGLLLGAIGLAVAQFRNLLERRGELALMRAAGFSRPRLWGLVLRENLVLLLTGLLVGALAAVVVLAPLAVGGDARPPWLAAIALLAATTLVGLLAAGIASRQALSAPLTAALRGD